MANLDFKARLDTSEMEEKIRKLHSQINDAISKQTKGDSSATTAINSATEATKKLKDAQLANIEALRQSRLEAAKQKQEQAELNQAYLQGKITAQEYALAKRKQADADKEAARQARETKRALMANSEYSQLASALNTVRNQAKNTLAEMAKLERQGRKNSAAYQDLTQKSRLLVSQTQVLDNQIKRIDATVGQHQRKVGNYGDAISMVAPQLSMFAGRLGLVAAGVAAVNQSFTSNLRMEPINMALKVGSGNAEQFNKNLEFLRETTDRLGLEFISTSNAFKMWQGAAKFSNLTANETRGIFESVANAGAKMKLSNEQVEGTFLALSQMLSKGKVQAEELRGQLGERLPGAFALAAKAMGITEQELNKMLEKGEVIADEFLPRFAAQLDKSFGNDKSERIQGMQASVNRLKNEFDKLWQSERASGFFTVVTDGFARMFKDINLMVNSKSWAEFKAIAFGGQEEHAKWQQSQKSPIQNIMEDFQKQSKAEMESSIIAYKKTVDHFKKEGMSKDLKFNEAILYRMTDEYKKQYGVVKAINSSTTGEKSKRVASEQLRAMERQRALQLQIDQINQQSLRGQLSRDEQEVASIRDKYAKIREEVRKFYADPKNKGLRVNMGGVDQAESFEVSEATTRQETARLVEQLNKQKALYDEYNAYVEKNGADAADRLFGKQAEIAKSYRAELDAEYISLLGKQKSASTGGSSTAKFTQAEEERLKQLQAIRDALQKSDEQKIRSNMDAALKMAQSFNDKRLEIERKYQEARKALGNDVTPEQEQELQRKESKELSQLASEELSQTDAWQKLFSDLDALTASQIDKLVKEIDSKFDSLSGTFDPIDLAAIRKRLNEARDMIIADNPFKQVGVAMGEIFKSSSKDSKTNAEDIKRNWNNLAKATEGSFQFVADAVNSAGFLKDAIGDVGHTALMSLTAVATTAIAVSTAIKTAEKASVILAIIQAALVVVNAIAGLFKSIFNAGDKRLEKSIESKRKSVEELDRAFQQLERSMNRAAGSDYYKTGEQQIANLKEQLRITEQMVKDEEAKKKTDQEKVQDYKDQIQSIGNQIEDVQQQLVDTLLQSTFRDLADDLADALVSAMQEGENAIDGLNKAYDDFIKNAIINSSKMMFLEPVIDQMMKQAADYARQNNYSLDGFNFNAWRDAIEGAGGRFIENVEDMFGGLGLDMDEATSSLKSEGISRELTEQTGNEIVGMYRAGYDIWKQQLAAAQIQTETQKGILALANDKLIALNAIQINTANTVNRLDVAVGHLQKIVNNTSQQSTRAYT